MDTLLYVGLANAAMASGLALVAAGVGCVCRRPALVHSLWLLVLLKLVTPPFVGVPVSWPAHRGTSAEPTHRSSAGEGHWSDRTKPGAPVLDPVERLTPELATPRVEPKPRKVPRRTATPPRADAAAPGRPVQELARRESPGPVISTPPRESGAVPWQVAILLLWAAGSVAWWGATAYRIVRFRRLCPLAAPPPTSLEALVRQLAGRLGVARCPWIGLVPAPISPLLWALGTTPRLLLPSALWERLTPQQQRALLVHELAHLRRGDHWVRRLELLVGGLYWWLPTTWWARRELHEAEEQCCDAWVVWALPDCAPAYAAALLETVAFLSGTRPALPVTASGIGHVPRLKRRLIMILRGTPPRALSGAGLLAVLALGVLFLPLGPTRADLAPSDKPQADPTTKKTTDLPPVELPPEKGEPVAKTTAQPDPGPKPKATTGTTRVKSATGDELEAARDEVELLEAQLEGKRAEVQEAMARLKQAKVVQERVGRLVARKAVSEEEAAKAALDVEVFTARLQGKQAQVREAELRLKQARRRLVRLQDKSKPSTAPAPKEEGRRLLCQPAVVDFGVVQKGTVSTYSCSLVNYTTRLIEIGPVRTSCGCATATPRQHLLASGHATQLEVRVDTRRFKGPKIMKFFVPYKADSAPQRELEILVRADSRDNIPKDEMPAADPTEPHRKVKELEKKIDELLKELNALRRALKRPK